MIRMHNLNFQRIRNLEACIIWPFARTLHLEGTARFLLNPFDIDMRTAIGMMLFMTVQTAQSLCVEWKDNDQRDVTWELTARPLGFRPKVSLNYTCSCCKLSALGPHGGW